MALEGGPYYSFTPAISLFVDCKTPEEIDTLWAALSKDGKIRMDLGSYPFGERFGWVQDKFGLTWQLNLARKPQAVSPFLMFVGDQHGRAEEAINRYVSLFTNAAITSIAHYGPDEDGPEGTVKHAVFTLEGGQFEAIDSHWPHAFTFSGAISFMVLCHTQQEIDHFWDALCDGGTPEQCGWLRDRHGVTWQIVPAHIAEMLSGPDPDRTKAVMDALLDMVKIDLATLERAYRGE